MSSNTVDYGTPERPNLEAISDAVLSSLKVYNQYLMKGVDCFIRGDPQLQSTPEKPNTARVVLDFLYKREKVGDLYVILFAPGDGTGKQGDYHLDCVRTDTGTFYTAREKRSNLEVQIPEEYQFEVGNKPEKILPRNKRVEGVLMEACFPLGTFEGKFSYQHIISLEQITVDNVNEPTRLIKGLQIGRNSASYATLVKDHPKSRVTISSESEQDYLELPIYLTCGYRRNGERFGDPHATFYNPKLAEGHPNRMQVAGFLSVENKDNPLCKVLDEVGIVPE